MCLWRSLVSGTIDTQFETGATHDMRIFTGSALLAEPARPSTHTPASARFKRRIFSSQFRPACALKRQASRCENGKIVGGPTDFGKPAACGKRPAIRYTQAVLGACAS